MQITSKTHIVVQEHECSVSDIAALVSAEMRTDQDYTIMDIKGVEIPILQQQLFWHSLCRKIMAMPTSVGL